MKTRQDKLRRLPQMGAGTTSTPMLNDWQSNQATGKSVSSTLGSLSPFIKGVITSGELSQWAFAGKKDEYGVRSRGDAGQLIGGFVNPLESSMSAYGDIKKGKFDWGTAWNLALPGVGSMLDQRQLKKERNSLLNAPDTSMYSNQNPDGSINNYTAPWQAAYGGVVPGGQPNVELEKNEVTMGPDGTMKQFNLPSHPNNSRVPLEEGTVVYSDNPKMRMPDGLLPAEAANKLRKIKNSAQKILENKSASILARKSAERNIQNADKKLGAILSFQVSKAMELGLDNQTNADGTEVASIGTLLGSLFKGGSKEESLGKIGNIASTVSSLAPVLYNLQQSGRQTEYLNPASFQNPMAYGALQSMRNRVPNMTPALQATDYSTAVANANLRNTASGRGQYAANSVSLANANMAHKANIYAQGSQQRNQYLGDYAQMQASLGQKMADTNMIISDLNARNQAAGRNYGAAASGQYGQFAQIQQQMANQKAMDARILEQWKSYNSMLTPQKVPTNNLKAVIPMTTPPVQNQQLAPKPLYTPYVDPAYQWQMQGR